MSSEHVRMHDYARWAELKLDEVMARHEMIFCEQFEEGDGTYAGAWFMADDATHTIIWGTFCSSNSPGSSHDTFAEVYSDEDAYLRALDDWNQKPEFEGDYTDDIEDDEDEFEGWEDEDEDDLPS